MNVTFWLDGEDFCGTHGMESGSFPLAPGDRLWVNNKAYVVAERWSAVDGWHIVLHRPATPAEQTPPWKRKEEG